MKSHVIRAIVFWLVLVGFGFSAGSTHWSGADTGPAAPPAFQPEDPRARGLDANLYMQTGAEYRACCLQAYNLGLVRLKELLSARVNKAKTPAVIMDLDETVFDNAGFQASQLRSGLGYDSRLWDIWERDHSAHIGLIPGANEFIVEARELKVAVIYISNRSVKYSEQASDALTRLGIPVDGADRLKLSSGSNDKTERIRAAEAAYDVLLLFGDNLRDFDEQFKCSDLGMQTPDELDGAIQARKAKVDAAVKNWGQRWIILPNPAYGEWTKPLGLGTRDYDRLVPVAR